LGVKRGAKLVGSTAVRHWGPAWIILMAASCGPKSGSTTVPRPPGVQVPPGCEADQSGVYRHAEDPSFHYLGRDDGGSLVLQLERPQEDGGPPAARALAPIVALQRTPHGFSGATQTQAFVGTRPCEVAFPAQVIACSDGGLVLRAAARASLDESCKPPPGPATWPWVDHHLLRERDAPPAPSSGPADGAKDGGT
jgi:hypothetical protein